jgi:uncharacterized iron-regulated membrane protein
VQPHVNPITGRLYELEYNQVFVDPVTGTELGKREWGAVSLARENFVSFLYKLHFTLHMPEMWGIDDWGTWLLGVIAIIWMLDCFSGFFLTLPRRRRRWSGEGSMPEGLGSERNLLQRPLTAGDAKRTWWQRWQPAWRIRWRGGQYKLNFDLHRAGSLWTWGLLFILAFTAFSLNLYREVFLPVMSVVSNVTRTPFDMRTQANKHQPIKPMVSYGSIIEDARREAAPGMAGTGGGRILRARLRHLRCRFSLSGG